MLSDVPSVRLSISLVQRSNLWEKKIESSKVNTIVETLFGVSLGGKICTVEMSKDMINML